MSVLVKGPIAHLSALASLLPVGGCMWQEAARCNRLFLTSCPTACLQIAPEVASVEPHSGSAGGGQLLTIRGSRFPASASAGAIQVTVGGRPCTVESSASEAITCRTVPQQDAWDAQEQWQWQDPAGPLFQQTGRFPGGSGIPLAK